MTTVLGCNYPSVTLTRGFLSPGLEFVKVFNLASRVYHVRPGQFELDLRCEKHTSTMLQVQTLFSSPDQSQGRCYFKEWLAPLQSQTRMLQVQTLFCSPGIWVVCSRPLKNDEQAAGHYYLKNDRQAVEHYQRTADAGKLSRTCHFNLARNS